tara:strand:- start:1198 stop:1875 length:678 start_codon:yes stop_codon:yes gene_type:complete
MQSSTAKTFIFALLMCFICSITLTFARVSLKDMQDRNVKIDQQKNILKAFALLNNDQKYTSDEIESIYAQNIKTKYMNENGSVSDTETNLPIFIMGTDNEIEKYAIHFSAYGLWSYINGYLAIAGDGNTVIGMTVYSHMETPGLGGECEKPWFQDQYIGKKITDIDGEFVSIGIVKGKVKDVVPQNQQANYVDGMSGATITSDGIARDLKAQLEVYEPLSKRLRG